jgi:hypothetical protein
MTLKFLQSYAFSPRNSYGAPIIMKQEWTFIYRFMHNLIGLFTKC